MGNEAFMAMWFALGGIGMCAAGIVALRMWLKAWTSRNVNDEISAQAVDRLRQEMHDIARVHGEQLDELHERLDFAERLLAQQQRPLIETEEVEEPTPA